MFYGLLEIEIMNSLWKLQQENEDANISIADIVKALSENDVDRAYTTIKTVMDRLVAKEVLVRYRNGKKFFYRSIIEKDEAAKNALDTIANQFFNGDSVHMIRFIEKHSDNILV